MPNSLGQTDFTAGTVGSPTLRFGDATTGLYRSAANEIGFSVSGSQVMRIDSTGVVYTGGTTFTGDIGINGGDLTSSAATFNLLNTLGTALNIAGTSCPTVTIGHASGVTTLNLKGVTVAVTGALTGTSTAAFSGDVTATKTDAAANTIIGAYMIDSAQHGSINCYRAQYSAGIAASNDTDVLAQFAGFGYNSSGAYAPGAYIRANQVGAAGATYIGARLQFYTGTNAAAPTTAGYIKSTKEWHIGTGDTNYAEFDGTGHLTWAGTGKPWEDLRIEPVARTTGANAPTFEQWYTNGSGSRGVYLYSFDNAASGSEKEVFFTMQMPHAWDGGNICVHVHWIGAVSDTTSAPRWALEYNWKEAGQVFGNTTIVYSDGVNYTLTGTDANITANTHYISKFADLTPGATADGLSSILIGRIFRDSDNAADTYDAGGAKCGLLYIDAHYQLARVGSTDEYTA